MTFCPVRDARDEHCHTEPARPTHHEEWPIHWLSGTSRNQALPSQQHPVRPGAAGHDGGVTDAPAYRIWPPIALGAPLLAGVILTAAGEIR